MRILRLTWSVAATVVIGLMVTFFALERSISGNGNDYKLELPCGSIVTLEGNATIKYNELLWIFERRINLVGDAFFDVSSGRKFSVKTVHGTVRVIGTIFNIESDAEMMSVKCYEGVVNVDDLANNSVVLSAGEMVECSAEGMNVSDIDKPLDEHLYFCNTPLPQVVAEMKNVFGLQFTDEEPFNNILYTGIMSTQDVDEALGMVFEACNIKYELIGSVVIIQ